MPAEALSEAIFRSNEKAIGDDNFMNMSKRGDPLIYLAATSLLRSLSQDALQIAEVKPRRRRGRPYMRLWWVNQNQTYRHEVQGGYLWSPKRNANGARNPFYESTREVAPGDLVFSFMDTGFWPLALLNPTVGKARSRLNSAPLEKTRKMWGGR